MSLMITPKSIFQELDNMFTTTFTPPTERTYAPSTSSTLLRGTAVSEGQTDFVLSYDLPGYEKKNISVELDPTTRYLTIKADPDDSANHLGGKSTNSTDVVYVYNELLNARKYSYKTKLVWPCIDLATPPRVVYENGVLRVIFAKLLRPDQSAGVLRLTPE